MDDPLAKLVPAAMAKRIRVETGAMQKASLGTMAMAQPSRPEPADSRGYAPAAGAGGDGEAEPGRDRGDAEGEPGDQGDGEAEPGRDRGDAEGEPGDQGDGAAEPSCAC